MKLERLAPGTGFVPNGPRRWVVAGTSTVLLLGACLHSQAVQPSIAQPPQRTTTPRTTAPSTAAPNSLVEVERRLSAIEESGKALAERLEGINSTERGISQ